MKWQLQCEAVTGACRGRPPRLLGASIDGSGPTKAPRAGFELPVEGQEVSARYTFSLLPGNLTSKAGSHGESFRDPGAFLNARYLFSIDAELAGRNFGLTQEDLDSRQLKLLTIAVRVRTTMAVPRAFPDQIKIKKLNRAALRK